jgi:ribose transport system substrate-binding protein
MVGRLALTGVVAAFFAGPALAQSFDDPKEFQHQRELLQMKPEGPADKPWEQHLDGAMVDTGKYKKPGPYKICFSNAGVGNPWRVVGWTTMQAEVEVEKADIAKFTVADAEGKDDKQISDIKAMLSSGACDILVVSPNTTAALTPAVEEACKKIPVITFDRGTTSQCPVTHIVPIGGYAFGIVGAEFIAQHVPTGGKVIALRILPGVDVLETRWSAAKHIFEEKGIKVLGGEHNGDFTDGDRAKTKSIVADYLAKNGQLDGVWMDAGATSTAAIEAFEDAGMKYPVITGEDQQDFLQAWKNNKLTAIAPTYPTYQWRTAIMAAVKVLKGEPIPAPVWDLPDPAITQANLDKFVSEKLPPLHYGMCGCEGMPGYPERWGVKK